MPIDLSLFLSLLGLPVMNNGPRYPSKKAYLGFQNPYYKLLHDNGNPLYLHGRDPLGYPGHISLENS